MPQAILLPEQLAFRRQLRSNRRHTDGLPLDASDLSQYDDDTVFYDAFFNIGNTRLYLLGPPMLNLLQLLTPLTLKVNEQIQRTAIKEYFKGRITIVEVDVENLEVKPVNQLEIDFNGHFTYSGNVPENTLLPHKRILSTLQKNNEIHWIRDWVNFYRLNFDIDQVVIYDNGSENFDELKTALPDVVFESWPYKHGITRSHLNKYCQYGSLNHCRLKYGKGSIVFNFDIDELLFYPTALIDRQMQTHDILFFDSYNVPIKKQLTGNYSYSDFHTRETGNKGRAFKYVYKSDSVVANSVHFIRTQKSDRAERIYRQFARLHKAIRKRTHGGSSALKKLSNYMGKKLRAKFIDPTAEGYFLHYYGITTNWKGAYYDRLTSENSAKPDVAIETEKLENIKRSTRQLD